MPTATVGRRHGQGYRVCAAKIVHGLRLINAARLSSDRQFPTDPRRVRIILAMDADLRERVEESNPVHTSDVPIKLALWAPLGIAPGVLYHEHLPDMSAFMKMPWVPLYVLDAPLAP